MHLDTGRGRDVGGGDQTRALLAQVHHDGLVVLRGDDELLDVEDQVGDVLLDARHGGELVQDPVDADAGDSGTGDGGEEGATEGVAERVAEAGLQRLDDEPRAVLVDNLFGQRGTLSDQHGDVSFSRGRPLFDVLGHRAAARCCYSARVRAVRRKRGVPPGPQAMRSAQCRTRRRGSPPLTRRPRRTQVRRGGASAGGSRTAITRGRRTPSTAHALRATRSAPHSAQCRTRRRGSPPLTRRPRRTHVRRGGASAGGSRTAITRGRPRTPSTAHALRATRSAPHSAQCRTRRRGSPPLTRRPRRTQVRRGGASAGGSRCAGSA